MQYQKLTIQKWAFLASLPALWVITHLTNLDILLRLEPVQPLRLGGLPFITMASVHMDIQHLATNTLLWFLFVPSILHWVSLRTAITITLVAQIAAAVVVAATSTYPVLGGSFILMGFVGAYFMLPKREPLLLVVAVAVIASDLWRLTLPGPERFSAIGHLVAALCGLVVYRVSRPKSSASPYS